MALGQRVVRACGPNVRIHRLDVDKTAGHLTHQCPHETVHQVNATVPTWCYRTHDNLLQYRVALLKTMAAVDCGLLLGVPPKHVMHALMQALRYVHVMMIDVEHNADKIETILQVLSASTELPEKATPK